MCFEIYTHTNMLTLIQRHTETQTHIHTNIQIVTHRRVFQHFSYRNLFAKWQMRSGPPGPMFI